MSPDAIKLAIVIPLLSFTLLLIAFSSRCQLLASGQLHNNHQEAPPVTQATQPQLSQSPPLQTQPQSQVTESNTPQSINDTHNGGANLSFEEKLTRLLLTRFGHLFVEQENTSVQFNPISSENGTQTSAGQHSNYQSPLSVHLEAYQQQQAAGSPLETRNDEINQSSDGTSSSSSPAALPNDLNSVRKRNYFRVLDHVFSRVELPQVFRSPKVSSLNSYCANFIGCIDDIPGLPAILRRSNISATFTIYTATKPKGVRIPYEPLAHHQLGDVNLTVAEIAQRLQLQQKHQLAAQKHLQNQLIMLNQHALANPLQQQILQLNQINKITRPLQTQSSNNNNQFAIGSARPANIFMQNAVRRSQQSGLQLPTALAGPKISAKSWQSGSILKRVQEYPFDLSALEASGFRGGENSRVIIGGYFAKEDEHWIEDLVDLWRQLEPSANIIKVSWPDANRGLYHSAALNSRVVGRQLSLLLHYLDQMFSIELARFHLVGHSLGAHIAGFVGSDNGGRIGRITGLDPAGPIFVDMDESMRLDPSDATFVDVVHTNAGSITKGALGLTTPSGHVDYYPNGGSVQPGCISSGMAIMDPVERVACNHRRSYRYFIEILRLTIEQRQQQHQQQMQNIEIANQHQQQHQLDSAGQQIQIKNGTSIFLNEPVAVTVLTRKQRQALSQQQHQQHLAVLDKTSSTSNSIRPTAFLFEAKDDELDRLQQPDLLCLDSKILEPRHRSEECELNDLPARRLIEFHSLKSDFPAGRRGLYYLKTRPEAPFFSSRQFGVTLRSANSLKRKIAISMKLDKNPLTDFDLEQIDSSLTVLFVPSELSKFNSSADLWFMWRYKSFTLLSSQPDELSLSGLELLELETSANPSVIKYSAPNGTSQWQPAHSIGASSSSNSQQQQQQQQQQQASYSQLRRAVGNSDWPALVRNRWYRFERT